MFFSFQLIATPAGARSAQYRNNIERARNTLRTTPAGAPGSRLASNATHILDALASLWEGDFVHMPAGPAKDALKSDLLKRVRTLAFPFHESDIVDPAVGEDGVHPIQPIGLSHDNSSIKREPTQAQVATFGNTGVLRPDMSVSGRIPIINADAYSYHPPFHDRTSGASTGYADPSQAMRMSGFPIATTTQLSRSDRSPLTFHAPHPSVNGTSHAVHAPHNAAPSHRSVYMNAGIGSHIYAPPNAAAAGAFECGFGIEGISQEMPWGASVGIAAGEWAGFMQTMAISPMSAGGATVMQPPALYAYNQDQGRQTHQLPHHPPRGDHM